MLRLTGKLFLRKNANIMLCHRERRVRGGLGLRHVAGIAASLRIDRTGFLIRIGRSESLRWSVTLQTGFFVLLMIPGSVLMRVMAGAARESIAALQETTTLHQPIRRETL